MGGETDEPNGQHRQQYARANSQGPQPAVPAGAGDSRVAGQAAGGKRGNQRTINGVAGSPDADGGRTYVGRQAEGVALLQEDHPHVRLPSDAVPQRQPSPDKVRAAVLPGLHALELPLDAPLV